MPRKPLHMKLTKEDFIWLGQQFDYPAEEMTQAYESMNTDEQKYNYFHELMMKNPRKWEYVHANGPEELKAQLDSLLPVEIRNDGDLDRVENFVTQNQDTLQPQAKCMLIQRMESLRKAADIREEMDKRAQGDKVFENRFGVNINGVPYQEGAPIGDNDYISLDGAGKKERQTAGMGCFSVSMEMMVRAQGIGNVTQEDIRGFRPHYSQKKLRSNDFQSANGSLIDKNFHDHRIGGEVPEMADAALAMAPDSMMRVFTIEPLKPFDKRFANRDKGAYVRAAVKQAKEQIRYALTVDKCPISFNLGGHYVTITGIIGDTIVVDDPAGGAGETKRLDEVFSNLIDDNRYIHLIWMTDINLTKDLKKIHGVPSDYLEVNEDGTMKLPPKPIRESADRYKGVQENDTIRIMRYAKKEDTFTDQENRDVFVDGVITAETVILPKKLNMATLKRRAQDRTAQEEEKLLADSKKLYGRDFVRKMQDDTKIDLTHRTLEPSGAKKVRDDFDAMSVNIANILAVDEEKRANEEFFKQQRRREQEERDKEHKARYREAVGKIKGYDNKGKAPDGKYYAWNYDGISVAFQLRFVMNKMEALYKAAGKDGIPEDIREEYNKLKEKIVPIPEDNGANIHGFKDGGVEIPGVGKITHCILKWEDVTAALRLLNRISGIDGNSIGGRRTFSGTRGDYQKYDPTLVSFAGDNLGFFANFENGNMLRLFTENPYYYEIADKMLTVPTDDMQLANTPKSKLEENGDNATVSYLNFGTGMHHMMQHDLKMQRLRNHVGSEARDYWIHTYEDEIPGHNTMIQSSLDQLIKPDGSGFKNERAGELMKSFKNPVMMQDFLTGKSMAVPNGWNGRHEQTLYGIFYVVNKEFMKGLEKKDPSALAIKKDTLLDQVFTFATAKPKRNYEDGRASQAMRYLLYAFAKHPDAPCFAIMREQTDVLDEICMEYYKKPLKEKMASVVEEIDAEHRRRREAEEEKKRKEEEAKRQKQEQEKKKKEEEENRRKAEEERKQKEAEAKRKKEVDDKLKELTDSVEGQPEIFLAKFRKMQLDDAEGKLKDTHKEAMDTFCREMGEQKTEFWKRIRGRVVNHLATERVDAYMEPAKNSEDLAFKYTSRNAQVGLPKIGAVAKNKKLCTFICRKIAELDADKTKEKLQKNEELTQSLGLQKNEIIQEEAVVVAEKRVSERYKLGKDILSGRMEGGEGIEVKKDGNRITVTIPEAVAKREAYLREQVPVIKNRESEQRQNACETIFSPHATPAEKRKAAALLIAIETHKNDLNEAYAKQKGEYSIQAHNDRVKASKEEIEKDPFLAPYFANYVKGPNIEETFKANQGRDFGSGYQNYKVMINNLKDAVTSSQESLVKVPQGQEKDSYSIDEIRQLCEKSLSDTRQIPKVSLDQHMRQAADYVALSFLVSQGAKRMFFGKGTNWSDQNEANMRGLKADANGQYKLEDVNKAAINMRNALLEDEAFVATLMKGGKLTDLYESYTKQVRTAINEKTRQQEAAPKVPAAQGETYTLTEKDLDYFKKTKKEIDSLYRSGGKYKSDYMKNLSAALDTVITQAQADPEDHKVIKVEKNDLDNLSKHARIYYKERQGRFFDPVTDRGKARLEVVENMIRKTDKMVEGNKEARKNNQNPAAARKA
ncbi:MAG: hypothetical protein IK078_03855 [Lachnospiraceae bacterium]|nr:hypothetical protein [Lachnospiraceae bacterium]